MTTTSTLTADRRADMYPARVHPAELGFLCVPCRVALAGTESFSDAHYFTPALAQSYARAELSRLAALGAVVADADARHGTRQWACTACRRVVLGAGSPVLPASAATVAVDTDDDTYWPFEYTDPDEAAPVGSDADATVCGDCVVLAVNADTSPFHDAPAALATATAALAALGTVVAGDPLTDDEDPAGRTCEGCRRDVTGPRFPLFAV